MRFLIRLACAVLWVPPLALADSKGFEIWREARPLTGTLVEIHAERAKRRLLRDAADAAHGEISG